jgi:hypothetical protein
LPQILFTTEDCCIIISLPLSDKGATLSEIIARADMINHAIPTKMEIEVALTKGIQSGLVSVSDDRYQLNEKHKLLFEKVYSKQGGLFSITSNLYNELNSQKFEVINEVEVSISAKEYKSAIEDYLGSTKQ